MNATSCTNTTCKCNTVQKILIMFYILSQINNYCKCHKNCYNISLVDLLFYRNFALKAEEQARLSFTSNRIFNFFRLIFRTATNQSFNTAFTPLSFTEKGFSTFLFSSSFLSFAYFLYRLTQNFAHFCTPYLVKSVIKSSLTRKI